MDEEGFGRTAGFTESARRASAIFHTSQVGAGRDGYRPTSVMEPVTRSSIGFADPEARRILPHGVVLPTANGESDETYNRRMWLQAL
jgi:hypothetical protein